MNNLKRVFSLALTGVMLSGMMVMGASAADFSDSEEIVNQEAVDASVALNIINGRDDGTFDPQGLVTRAEMAKMIATAMNGGVTPEYGTKPTPSFTDIKGCWAEQYIEYCNNMKIIAGRGDGTFDPYGKVTGVEAAKMVLTALGYDATAFKLVGADWDSNVNYEATWRCDPSLYDELNGINMYQPITRDTAAQLIWNGVQNKVMVSNPDKEVATGNVTDSYVLSAKTLFEVKYGGKEYTGTFNGNDKTNSGIPEGQIEVGSYKFPADLDISYIGEEVKVMYKDGSKGTDKQPDENDTIYGVFPTGATTVYNVPMTKVGAVSSDGKKIKIDGTDRPLAKANTITVVDNYDDAGTSKASKNDIETALKVQSGDTVKFVTNAKGEITTAYVVNYNLSKVTNVTSSKITLSGIGAVSIEDNDIYDGVAKDDIVVYTRIYHATDLDKAFFTVTKAETVDGTLTGYKGTESVTVGGTTYKIHNESLSTLPENSESSVGDTFVDEKVTLYLVNGLVAAVAPETDAATEYALILSWNEEDVDGDWDSAVVQVLLPDGTKQKMPVHKDSTYDGTTKIKGNETTFFGSAGANLPILVKYGMSGEAIKIKDSATDSTGAVAGKLWDKDAKTFAYDNASSTDKTAVAASKATLFVTNSTTDKEKAYSLRELRTIDTGAFTATAGEIHYFLDNGRLVAAYVTMAANPRGNTSDTLYGMVISEDGKESKDGDVYTKYTVWTGANTVVYVDGVDGTADVLVKGNIVKFDESVDQIYNEADFTQLNVYAKTPKTFTPETVTGWSTVAVKELQSDNTLVYYTATDKNDNDDVFTGTGDANSVTLDDDVVIVYVNGKDVKAGDDTGITGFNDAKGFANAMIHVDSGVVDVVILETTGEISLDSSIPTA